MSRMSRTASVATADGAPSATSGRRITRGLYTSASPEWYTPNDLLAEIAAFFGGSYFDPCPPQGKAVADGLAIPWRSPAYVNSPYGNAISSWIDKAVAEPVDELMLLVPARTDTRWFRKLWGYHICFLYGRLKFVRPGRPLAPAPFPSALAYRGPRGDEFAAAFAHRGETEVRAARPHGQRVRVTPI